MPESESGGEAPESAGTDDTRPAGEGGSLAEDVALAAAGTAMLGVPVPPSTVKRLIAATNRLVTSIFDVPIAALESVSQWIRDGTNARSVVARGAADAAAARFGEDPALAVRAANYYGARILREQRNRETIVAHAVEDIKADPPTEDVAGELNEDWLDMFARVAEQRSDEDMRRYLAKILAGEIRAPGSFDPGTIQVLATLTPRVAELFQRFCNISSTFGNVPCVITSCYGRPGGNGLAPVGLGYLDLTALQDAGLIQHDFNSRRELPIACFAPPPEFEAVALQVAGRSVRFSRTEKTPETEVRISCINFTAAGAQLRRIAHLEPNAEYIEKLVEWTTLAFTLKYERG